MQVPDRTFHILEPQRLEIGEFKTSIVGWIYKLQYREILQLLKMLYIDIYIQPKDIYLLIFYISSM